MRKLAMLAVLLLVSCSGRERNMADRMVDIGTHRLHTVVIGEGSPAVVIDGGIGEQCGGYRALQDRIASSTTVVTYDRAGYGSSEAGPLPRDSGTAADELRALLTELNIPGPYVLVGHSLGGLNVEVYANRYPNDVAGMVLLDPPPLSFVLGRDFATLMSMAEQMTVEWQAIADRGADSEDAQERAEAVFFRMLASEHREMFDTSARLAEGIETFGDIPLVVIAAGVPNPMFGEDAVAYQKYWIEQSRVLSAKSRRGEFVLAKESTHQLHIDAANLVAERVLSVLEEAREQQ
jgi:pimeloyl-ACP methyl ester carboxylesterase